MTDIFSAYSQNEAAIRRYLRRFSANADEIDEMAQETFLRAFAAEMRAAISEPKAYLFQTAKNIALERRRKNERSPTGHIEDFGGADIIIDETQVSAEDWLTSRQKLAVFAMAVAQLPPQCRRAFIMRRLDGLSYKQIANRMNISMSAVAKHIAAGVLKCSAFLEEQGYRPAEFGAAKKEASGVTQSSRRASREGGARHE